VTPEQWHRVKEVFEAALERDSSQRAAFLDEACDGDVALRREVESLIESYEKEENFMSLPAMAAAAKSLLDEQAELVGQMVGRYKILAPIGAGGMGEVYLSHDTRLGRQVALKLLPTYLRGDSDRLRRFQQEARAASSLNHPNVCMVHEVGEMEGGRHYIVMEHIEGLTLRQQMASQPLRLGQALDVATQVAAALAAAHGAGIVHRDIKPENLMLRNDGLIKVLDFGLAKRITVPVVVDDGAATKVLGHTEPGMVMGTVAYMSPEQARGLEVDARTDIWSLGVVLYEMVAGNVPFAGATQSDLIVSILDREPLPLDRHLPDVPTELQRIVSKALRKDKEERYQVVKDLFLDLKSLKQELEFEARLQHSAPPELSSDDLGRAELNAEAAHNLGQPTKEVQTARKTLSVEFPNRKPLLWAAGVLGGLLLIAVGAWYFSRLMTKPVPTPPVLTAVPLTTDPGYEGMASLSPDGSQVAFASFGYNLDNLDIYVKQIGGGGPPLRLTSDPAVDKFPAWSPDGRSIAFVRERGDKDEVVLIPAIGGPERRLAETAPDLPWEPSLNPPYLSWSPDSKYLVTVDRTPGEPTGLFVLSVATGEKRRLTTPPAPAVADTNPAVSPDGRMLAFVRVISDGNPQLYVLPLSEDYRPTGEARRLDVPQPWVVNPAWTADGREIVCDAGPPWVGGMLWRISVSDSEKPVLLAALGKTSYEPTVSRQGNRLVYQVWTWDPDIWRAEVSGGDRSRPAEKLIASTRQEFNAQYSPDGSRVAFSSDRSGNSEIWVCNGDGSNPVQLTSLESSSGTPRWFPDGRRIVFDSQKEGQEEIYVIDTETRVPRRLTSDPSDDVTPSVSHDGKWIYFGSTRTGRLEIWRLPAEGGQAVQVTHEGGAIPFESLDGKKVYYQKKLAASDVWQVPVAGGEETRVLGPAGQLKFAVVADGIYFIEPGPPGYAGWIKGNSLKFFSFAKGTAEKVFDIKYLPQIGLSLSPDGRYVLFSQTDPFVCDLMLVENFR
jgi:eukaryotic-like serine/threonine-protein kinase